MLLTLMFPMGLTINIPFNKEKALVGAGCNLSLGVFLQLNEHSMKQLV